MVSLLGLGYLLSTALSSGVMMVALLFIDIVAVSYVSFATYLIYIKDYKIFESLKVMPYLEITFTNYCIELDGNIENDQLSHSFLF